MDNCSATFELQGSQGSANISIDQGESLTAVAERITVFTSSTGVAATASGDDLLLHSTEVGSSAAVAVDSVDVEPIVTVNGVKAKQIVDFQVVSTADNTQQVLTGTIDRAADEAELTYQGTSRKQVRKDATFTVTGNLGSVEISVSKDEHLTDVRNRVNAHTAETGVAAELKGKTLVFQSVDGGGNATAAIDVTSGTFNAEGGNER